VLQGRARTLNDDPTLLDVASSPTFFAFASHHDIDDPLFNVVRRDASPTAVQWLEDHNAFDPLRTRSRELKARVLAQVAL
jgi:hypothetical protein